MIKRCKVRSCNKKVHAHSLCNAHNKKRFYKLNPLKNRIYEKTPKGFIMRLYRNMKSRVLGIQKNNSHLYKGLFLLPKDQFYSWALNHPTFMELYNRYLSNGYSRKLAPSVDRINPDIGYKLKNMEWVTLSENSRRASITKRRLK